MPVYSGLDFRKFSSFRKFLEVLGYNFKRSRIFLFFIAFFQNRNQERKAGKNDFLVFMLTEGMRSVCFHITDWEHKNDIQNWSKSYNEIDFYIVESTWADVSFFCLLLYQSKTLFVFYDSVSL